jgi:hypothetical protein
MSWMILFKKQFFDLEVKGQGSTKVITVRVTLPYGHALTYEILLTYLKRQKCYGLDKKILLRRGDIIRYIVFAISFSFILCDTRTTLTKYCHARVHIFNRSIDDELITKYLSIKTEYIPIVVVHILNRLAYDWTVKDEWRFHDEILLVNCQKIIQNKRQQTSNIY